MHALGAGGDAAGFHDVQKQLQVGEIEAHALGQRGKLLQTYAK
jgi:hypothetical protein